MFAIGGVVESINNRRAMESEIPIWRVHIHNIEEVPVPLTILHLLAD